MKKAKGNKGITLVALIITVIILLILAGVTISLVIGENGLINKSKDTAKISFEKDVQESLELAIADLEISKTESGEKVEITDLLEKGYINEEGVININKLLGKKGQYGNGANNQDVFIIENNELWYYEKNGEGKKISKLSNLGYLKTPENYFELKEWSDKGMAINLANCNDYYENALPPKGKEAPLETYVLPNELNGEKIEVVGHFNAPNIKNIVIGEGLKFIEPYAFEGCTNLESITIPKSMLYIEPSALGDCANLKNIEVDKDNEAYTCVDGILYNKEKTKLICCSRGKENVEILDGVTEIGKNAFKGNVRNVTVSNTVKIIEESAFSNCSKLENITMKNSVEMISGSVFYGCRALKSIVIPKNISDIYAYTFYGCSNLKNITIPKTLKRIEYYAFNSCTNLTTINYEGTEEDWETINIKNGNDELKNVKINYSYKYQD